jgi:endonuclease YncB( thermonuclease family)
MNKKTALAIFLTFLLCANSLYGQDENDSFDITSGSILIEYEEECGSPFEESQSYDLKRGKITRIVSGNRVIFEQTVENGKKAEPEFTVKLAGIKPESNEKAVKTFLVENVLNKEIKIIGNTKKDSDKSFFGIIRGAGFADVNRHLLENGIADFAEPGYFYSVSRYTLCVYRYVTNKAKKEKLGIWKNDTDNK